MHTHDHTHPQGAGSNAEDMQACESAPACSENTPYSNTGCTLRNTPKLLTPPETPLCFRFDWYQVTLDKEVEPLTALQWGQFIGESVPGCPKNGYAVAHDYGQASISYGGATGEFGVNIKLTGGDACQDLVDYLRRSFPVHRPSRIDVCADFQGPTAWEDLKDLLIQTANHYDVPLSTFGDWVNGKNGRTLYVNPRKKGKQAPTYSARLYEKGHQMRAMGQVPDAPLDWVRLEFEIHPPKHTRHHAATMTPEELARSSRWMREICDRLGSVTADRVNLSTRRLKPSVIDSVECMFRQYSGPIREVKRDMWMTKEDWMQVCEEIWEKEGFNGLPAHVRRNWYF